MIHYDGYWVTSWPGNKELNNDVKAQRFRRYQLYGDLLQQAESVSSPLKSSTGLAGSREDVEACIFLELHGLESGAKPIQLPVFLFISREPVKFWISRFLHFGTSDMAYDSPPQKKVFYLPINEFIVSRLMYHFKVLMKLIKYPCFPDRVLFFGGPQNKH